MKPGLHESQPCSLSHPPQPQRILLGGKVCTLRKCDIFLICGQVCSLHRMGRDSSTAWIVAPSRSLCEAIFHAFLWSFSAIYHLTNAAWDICSCCKQTGELDQNNTSLNRGTVRGRFRHDAPVNMANTAHKEFMGLFPWTRFLSSHRKPHASTPNDNLGSSRWCVRRTGALTVSVSVQSLPSQGPDVGPRMRPMNRLHSTG